MFIEGKCYYNELPIKLRNAILSNPAWTMVSSNVGTTVNDDGYIFQSSGEDGNQKILIGFNPVEFVDTTNWHKGYQFFVLRDYTPNTTPGLNGTKFDRYSQGLAVMRYATAHTNYTPTTLPMKYWVSVKKDRVIIVTKPESTHSYAINNAIYLGRPTFTFDPKDRGVLIGTAVEMGSVSSWSVYSASMLMTGGPKGLNYNNAALNSRMTLKINYAPKNKVWGGKVFPAQTLLYNSAGNFRGLMDYLVLLDDGSLREIDNVKIGDVEYFSIKLQGYQDMFYTANGSAYSHYNNFWPLASGSMNLLIPKN